MRDSSDRGDGDNCWMPAAFCPCRGQLSMSCGLGGLGVLGLLVFHLLEATPDLRCTETAVPAERPNCGDFAGAGPTGHGLGIDPEEGSDLCGSKERICLRLISHYQTPCGCPIRA